MTIKCYLFTGVAKQSNHTYYSLGTNNWSRLYYNLIDFLIRGKIFNLVVRLFMKWNWSQKMYSTLLIII